MQSRNNDLSRFPESRIFSPSGKAQPQEAANRVGEVSVAGTRVICASKTSTVEIKRSDYRHRIQLELVASMLGFISCSPSYSLNSFRTALMKSPLTPLYERGERLSIAAWSLKGKNVLHPPLGKGGRKDFDSEESVGSCPYHEILPGKWGKDENPLPPVTLSHDALGKPVLFVEDARGPSVSFSYAFGTAWGALCEEGFQCGIDSARAEEFYPGYPLGRAFGEEELMRAKAVILDDPGEAAAALWSAKEAAVKAIGCGFHLIDPLQVSIMPDNMRADGFEGHAAMAEPARNRMPLSDKTFPVLTFRHGLGWVSVAVAPPSEG